MESEYRRREEGERGRKEHDIDIELWGKGK